MKIDGTSSESIADTASTNYEPLFAAAGSEAEVGNLVCDAIFKKLSRMLGTPKEDIDTARPMYCYGVDSLVAVELRNWFIKDMNADVAIFGRIKYLGTIPAGGEQGQVHEDTGSRGFEGRWRRRIKTTSQTDEINDGDNSLGSG